MTVEERNETIDKINRDQVSPEDKQRRIAFVNQTYTSAQNNAAEEKRQKQQHADAQLKGRLKTAYMSNPAASDKDFERDYPVLKSDYLRGEALKQDAELRESTRRKVFGSI